jgi:hypothetical protein
MNAEQMMYVRMRRAEAPRRGQAQASRWRFGSSWAVPALFALAACGDDSVSEYPPVLPLDPQYTSCESDADCVVVELGCCDACNGGTAVAVRRDRVAAVQERYGERCGSSTACTLRGCPPSTASCAAGFCRRLEGSF